MSSPFSSALARLDDDLQTIQSQVDCLHAALEINDDQLSNSLSGARHHAAMLRDLIHEERPDAGWTDRGTLEQLIQELEIAVHMRRNEERRARLLNLADELDAGSIRHRFHARSTELNSLRLDAVEELRAEAALAEQEKDLPGPVASEWLYWVCTLQDEKDAGVLSNLRRDFTALERFAGEMEESYWIPGEPGREKAGQTSASSAGPAEPEASLASRSTVRGTVSSAV